MESDERSDIDVRQAVAIGEAEGFIVFDIAAHPLETSASHRLVACVDQRDNPRLGIPLMDLHAVFLHVERYIRHMKKIVGKILLYNVSFISAANNKMIY